jgi:hypothetical protein
LKLYEDWNVWNFLKILKSYENSEFLHILRYFCVCCSPVIYWPVNSLQETIARQTTELTFEPFLHWDKQFQNFKISKFSKFIEMFEIFWKFWNLMKILNFFEIWNFWIFWSFHIFWKFWTLNFFYFYLFYFRILKFLKILEILKCQYIANSSWHWGSYEVTWTICYIILFI